MVVLDSAKMETWKDCSCITGAFVMAFECMTLNKNLCLLFHLIPVEVFIESERK